ncbi:MAG: alpha/beta fold hydrolase [Deltaproteobacteria bacterium]|nr:alpha/beta fold hydrolase [Deltaproteobacteria bacterium]
MTIIVLFVLGIPALATLLTYTLFCYEEANRTGQDLGYFLKLGSLAAIRSALSEALVLALHPLGLWPGLWRDAQPGTAPVVVMVHGLFHNPSAWILFRRWFHARGFATACIGYSSWGAADLDQTIANVRQRVERIRQEHPGREIHLLGHSLGGLLLRAAVAELSCCPEIKTLTTLGAPFQGSKLAPFAMHSLGRFIWHESPTIRHLAALPFPKSIQGLALWSRADNMVLPTSALRCPIPGWKNQKTADISHIAMLHSREIFEETLRTIQAARQEPRGSMN